MKQLTMENVKFLLKINIRIGWGWLPASGHSSNCSVWFKDNSPVVNGHLGKKFKIIK